MRPFPPVLRWLLLLCGALAPVLFAAILIPQSSRTTDASSERASACRRRLAQLRTALAVYAMEHGSYPYHPKGEAHALYLLKPHLDKESLLPCSDSPDRATPTWDDENKIVQDSPWHYLNTPDVLHAAQSKIIAVSEPCGPEYIVCFLERSGRPNIRRFSSANVPLLLGNTCSDDGFIIVTDDLYRDWMRTSPGPNALRSVVENNMVTKVVDDSTRREHRYEYQGDRLVRRRIIGGVTDVIEHVTTDRFGRIVSVRREPSNWEEILFAK